MLLIREGLRFLRRGWRLSLPAALILAFGMTASALAIVVFLLFSAPSAPGTRAGNFATFAEQAHGGRLRPISWKRFEVLRDRLAEKGLNAAAYSSVASVPFSFGDNQRYIKAAAVSANFFPKFVNGLAAGDNRQAASRTCATMSALVISASLAQIAFGAPSRAIGETVTVRGVQFRVAAVAPENFHGIFDVEPDAWVPAQCVGRVFLGDTNSVPGLTAEAAASLADTDLGAEYPAFYGLVVAPEGMGTRELLRKMELPLRSSSGQDSPLSAQPGLTIDPERDERLRRWAMLSIFLAACLTIASSLNFAGLLLARIPRQMAEVNLRRAIGAGTAKLFLELCAGPSLVVVSSFACASACFISVVSALAKRWPVLESALSASTDRALLTMAWELLIAFVAVAIVAVVPAVRLLKESGAPRLSYTASSSAKTNLMLQVVVAAQVAFSICVLVVSAMVINASQQIFRGDIAFQAQHRAVFAISQQEGQQIAQFYRNDGPFPLVNAAEDVRRSLSSLPGVRSVAFALRAPLDSSDMPASVSTGDGGARNVAFNVVSQNYFDCLQIRFLAGRSFDSDSLIGPPVNAVLNRSLANLLAAKGSPGQMIKVTIPATRVALNVQVTGVIEDARTADPKTAPQPTVYLQYRGTALAGVFPWYVIVDSGEPQQLIEKQINRSVASQLPGMGSVYSYGIEDRLAAMVRSERQKQQVAVGGGLAVGLIALIGVYSSLMYFVSTHQREFAIRISCGATPQEIARIIFSKAMRNGVAAAGGSLILWPFLRQLVSSSLGLLAWSPVLAGIVTLAGCAAVLVVSALPALEANRIQIAKALKSD